MKNTRIIIVIIIAFIIGSIIVFFDKIKTLFQKKPFVVNPVITTASQPIYYAPTGVTTAAPTTPVITITEEKTVGGTDLVYPITGSMNFDNIYIFKTSLVGSIEITLDNGFVKTLINQDESWQHSAVKNKYFNINVVSIGGATYEYSGALI